MQFMILFNFDKAAAPAHTHLREAEFQKASGFYTDGFVPRS